MLRAGGVLGDMERADNAWVAGRGYTVCTIAIGSDLRFFAESSPAKLLFFSPH